MKSLEGAVAAGLEACDVKCIDAVSAEYEARDSNYTCINPVSRELVKL